MMIDLTATAPTLKEALAAIKDRKEVAQTALEATGVNKGSIKFGDATRVDDSSDRRRQMERQIRMQLARRRGKGALPASRPRLANRLGHAHRRLAAPPGNVGGSVAGGRRRASESRGGGRPGGARRKKKSLTPEEQEVADEVSMSSGEEEQQQEAKPRFAFVATVSDDERDKAAAEAFAKAKTHAARIAKAAGVTLGALVRLSDQSSGLFQGDDEGVNQGWGMNPYVEYQRNMQAALLQSGRDRGEVVSQQPGIVRVRVSIMTEFELK